VGASSGKKSSWQQQELVFLPQDPLLERWKATGFLIASLVGEAPAFRLEKLEILAGEEDKAEKGEEGKPSPQEESTLDDSPSSEDEPDKSEEPAPVAEEESKEAQTQQPAAGGHKNTAQKLSMKFRSFVDLQAQTSRALSGQSVRVGVIARGSYRFSALPLEALAGVGWSSQPSNEDLLSLRFLEFEGGPLFLFIGRHQKSFSG